MRHLRRERSLTRILILSTTRWTCDRGRWDCSHRPRAKHRRLKGLNHDNLGAIPHRLYLAGQFSAAVKRRGVASTPFTDPAASPRRKKYPPTTTTSYTQQYNTNNAAWACVFARSVRLRSQPHQQDESSTQYPKQVLAGRFDASGLPNSLKRTQFGLPAGSYLPHGGLRPTASVASRCGRRCIERHA